MPNSKDHDARKDQKSSQMSDKPQEKSGAKQQDQSMGGKDKAAGKQQGAAERRTPQR